MLSKKNIVVTVGNYGSVVAFHDGDEIKNKIFLEELNDKTKAEIKNVFASHKTAPIYILIDSVDQSYRKKVYPLVRRGDLIRLIKRDMASDGDKESFKNYIVLNNKNKSKSTANNSRWECLFVSSSSSDLVSGWIEFLLEMPNHLVGVYMLPVESFSLLNLLKKDIRLRSKVKVKHHELYCLILQNKVSGIRQIVFSDSGIVFTRVVNYNFDQPDFLEKYEQDIYSTFEYLKRLFPDISLAEIDIVNILPNEALEQLKKLDGTEMNFIHYTPVQAATQMNEAKLLPINSTSCDLLVSHTFAKSKKILKFSTPRIDTIEKFFVGLQASYAVNFVFLLATLIALLFSVLSGDRLNDMITAAQMRKSTAFAEFSRIQQLALEGSKQDEDGAEVDIEKITDFGKIDQALSSTGVDVYDFYSKLKFLRSFNVKLNSFSYSINNFNQKSPSPVQSYRVNLNGEIFNKSGDIEDLFSEFDSMVAKAKDTLNKNQVSYTDLPRNIDFNQKYYNFPIDFSITK